MLIHAGRRILALAALSFVAIAFAAIALLDDRDERERTDARVPLYREGRPR